MSITNFPNGVSSFGVPVLPSPVPFPNSQGEVLFVDGTYGSDGNTGKDITNAKATINGAIAVAHPYDTIYILPKAMSVGATDPSSYAENVIIPATLWGLSLVGVSRGRTQGGLPQIKKGSDSSAQLTVRAPGCLITNIGINGVSATGGGILLDDDGSTKTAFGVSILNCHFKNCVNSGDATTGGAIQWASAGNAWQILIKGNRFYKNVGGVVLLGTDGSVPQDVVIEDNIFGSGAATDVDCDIYLAGGSGAIGIVIRNNEFATVDVPQFAGGTVNKYMELTGCAGIASGNRFACTGKTFGDNAGVNAAFIPTTVRFPANYQENAIITRTS